MSSDNDGIMLKALAFNFVFCLIFGLIIYGTFVDAMRVFAFGLLSVLCFVMFVIPIVGFVASGWHNFFYTGLLDTTGLYSTGLTMFMFYLLMSVGLLICSAITVRILKSIVDSIKESNDEDDEET